MSKNGVLDMKTANTKRMKEGIPSWASNVKNKEEKKEREDIYYLP